MRILIVDDEPLARTLLREHVCALPDTEVIGEAANGFEAVRLTEELAPDLLLLDVQMPRLSGLEVAELLGDRSPAIVFVTAHDQYAVQAFAVQAIDYLLKPVEFSRLAQSLQRATARRANPREPRDMTALAAAARPPGQSLERVLIREETKIHVLPVHTLDYIEAQDDYVEFVAGGKRYRKQQTLAQLEAQLSATQFVRVHRSFIVNVERITRVEPYAKDSWRIFLGGGAHVPLSRTGYTRLKKLLV